MPGNARQREGDRRWRTTDAGHGVHVIATGIKQRTDIEPAPEQQLPATALSLPVDQKINKKNRDVSGACFGGCLIALGN